MTYLFLDYETKNELDLTKVGLDRYCRHPSASVIAAGFAFDQGPVDLWHSYRGDKMPSDLRDGLRDPDVKIVAFNAQFERWTTWYIANMPEIPLERFRCAMVAAYMRSFTGGLEDVGNQMGLDLDKKKLSDGKRLVKMFCGPNKPTKNQPFVWRDEHTDPDDWERFIYEYLPSDVVSERDIWNKLSRFEVPEDVWELYAIDQVINDRGLPINRRFVESAITLADRRKAELISEMQDITWLDNPNSVQQLLPWLQDRGFDYRDLQKDSIKKFITAEKEVVKAGVEEFTRPEWGEIRVINAKGKEGTERIVSKFVKVRPDVPPRFSGTGSIIGDAMVTQEARTVMIMRLGASKTSTAKYEACINAIAEDDRLRHCFQFCGASRTWRWAGRKIQPQNLPRTPKWLEASDKCFDRLDYVNTLIEEGDYETLQFFSGETMDAVSGCVRSMIVAPPGKKLVVCDLSSIETVVIGWLTGCERLLQVFRDGRCAYRDFATTLYGVEYDEVTGSQRTDSKPAVLGAGYRLSGGQLEEGKKTGLWGYAENMGINLSKDDSHRAVTLYRETYKEVPKAWYAIEDAIVKCLRTGQKTKFGPLTFELKKPFLRVTLPSGTYRYYYKAMVRKYEMDGKYGPYVKWEISYMGIDQITQQWTRIVSHGGKFIENFVQAIAMEILALGIREAMAAGFFLVGHVHDEIISEEDEDDEIHTHEWLRQIMAIKLKDKYAWLRTMPLNAAGYTAKVYRKD